MSESLVIEGVTLLGCKGIGERREDFDAFLNSVNGCGAGNARFDFIPDTMWGLDVTPICNLHDDCYVFCEPTRAGFNQANAEFYQNLKVWIRAKSNLLLVGPRLIRARTYYKAVDKYGWDAFVACKKELGVEVTS